MNLDIESIQKRVRGGDFKGVYEDLAAPDRRKPDMLGQVLESTEAMRGFLAVPSGKMQAEEAALIAEIPGSDRPRVRAGGQHD